MPDSFAPDSFVAEGQDSFVPEEGLVQGALKAGKNVLEGIGSGVARTATGMRDLVNAGTKAVGIGEIPDVPGELRKAGSDVQTPGQENSTGFSVGRGLETIGEFVAPGSMVTRGANLAAKAGSKVGPLAEVAAKIGGRAAGDAAAAGAITAAHGEGMEDIAKAALTAGALSGAFASVGTALKSIPSNRLYMRGLKFQQRFQGQREEEIIGKAIDDGILISHGGAKKAAAFEKMKQADVQALIQAHGQDLVDLDVVRKPMLQFRDEMALIGKTGIVKKINARLAQYEEAKGALPGTKGTPSSSVPSPVLGPNGQRIMHTTPGTPATPATPAKITIAEAQQDKNLLQSLASEVYGKGTKPSAAHIEKLLGVGVRQAIEEVVPEVKQLNRDAQNYKLLKQAITKYVNSNPELLSPRTAVLALWNSKAALVYGALQNPYIRSALAIAKDRAEKSAAPAVLQAVPRAVAGSLPTEGQQ